MKYDKSKKIHSFLKTSEPKENLTISIHAERKRLFYPAFQYVLSRLIFEYLTTQVTTQLARRNNLIELMGNVKLSSKEQCKILSRDRYSLDLCH